MRIEVSEEKATNLQDYAQIRMSFEVRQVFDVVALNHGLDGLSLSERQLQVPYLKDYDSIASPLQWPGSFDVSNWGVFVARSGMLRVGGAVVAFDTDGLRMLEDRKDIAVLWDIRVATEARRRGVGAQLFTAAEKWAVAHGCRCLKVETQNINVPACRFYAKQGCVLGAINRFAYPEFPNEVQLLWYKELRRKAG
jgi:ribosomal protein S18 acetylase RimI-like enzyme